MSLRREDIRLVSIAHYRKALPQCRWVPVQLAAYKKLAFTKDRYQETIPTVIHYSAPWVNVNSQIKGINQCHWKRWRIQGPYWWLQAEDTAVKTLENAFLSSHCFNLNLHWFPIVVASPQHSLGTRLLQTRQIDQNEQTRTDRSIRWINTDCAWPISGNFLWDCQIKQRQY